MTGLVGDDQRPMFISASLDGTFKLWQPRIVSEAQGDITVERVKGWFCAAVGDYHNRPCHALSLSR